MKKKIVAAVVALIMACSSLPAAEFAEFLPDLGISGISASAASSSEKVELEIQKSNGETAQVTCTKKDNVITVTLSNKFFDNKSEILINLSQVKEKLKSQGFYNENNEVVLNYKFDSNTYTLLSSVKFQDDFITTLGNNMFSNLKNFKNVDLGNSITKLGNNVFSGCGNFVGTSNNKVDLKNIVEIGDSAFSNCKSLAGAELSSSLTKIGKQAFSACTRLIEMKIPKSVESIGDSAFNGDAALDNVTFEEGSALKELGVSVFSACTSLSKINVGSKENTLPSGLTNVGKDLFRGCTSLQKFNIPDGLLYLSENMFSGCTSLSTVVFSNKSNCILIGKGAFQNCTAINNMTLPDSAIGIGERAFSGCSKLSKLILSDDTIEFGSLAFEKCSVLSLAPKSKESQLKSNQVIVPENVTLIPESCFANCTGITDVVMDKVSKDILAGAFMGCTSLKKVTIPDAIKVIHEKVFQGCSALESVIYSKDLEEFEATAFKDCTALKAATPSDKKAMNNTVQIPASCGAAQKEAFANCKSIKYINILGESKSQFATVGESAFSGCTSLEGSTTDGTSSQELKFPRLVTVLQSKAFEKCTSLKTVQFEGEVSTIGDSVFDGCSSLTKVVVNPTITQIGQSAFKDCKSLVNLPLTKSGASALTQLERIDKNTFQNCTALKTVDISAAKNIKAIDQNAFYNCSNMTKLILPANGALTSIGNSAFQNCSLLETVNTTASAVKSEFPKTIVSIGNNAFANTSLSDVTVHKPSDPNAYTTIGNSAFSNCQKLASVDLSDTNLTTLSENVFDKDKLLKTVKLPETLTTISQNAFNDCNTLSTINSTTKGTANLPKNLKTLGAYSLKNTYCISKIIIPAATDDIDMSAFNTTLTYTQSDLDSGKINPLKEFVVDSKNSNYKSDNGVLFSKDGTVLLRYPRMKAGTSYTVPNSVKEIAQSGMGSNNYLEKVTIGPNVTKIAKDAFNTMTSLKAVDFGKNTTVQFENGAFTGFTGNPMIVFYAAKGSTAEAYANENKRYIKFVDNNMMAATLEIKQGYNITASTGGGRIQLEAVLKTKSGAVTTDVLTWTSDNPEIASVDNNGNVTPRKNGVAKITVKSANGLTKTVTIDIGDQVCRLGEANRYLTAVEISKRLEEESEISQTKKSDTVILAYGLNYADALAGVPLAKALNAPILLTTTNMIPDSTVNEIKRLGAKNVIILGGTGVISDTVKKQLEGYGLKTDRISGKNRYGTAVEIANRVSKITNKQPTEVFFVYGLNYADALSVSTVAAIKNAPIIYLTTKGDMPKETKDYLATVKGKVKKAYVIGGDGVISDDMMKKAANALGLNVKVDVTRVWGANRYDTCVAINEKFFDVLTGMSICIATGQDFPDALAGGVLAAINKAPLFLVNSKLPKFTLSETQKQYLKKKAAKRFYVFGGEKGAVPADIVNAIKSVK